jgi:hypothetical protein
VLDYSSKVGRGSPIHMGMSLNWRQQANAFNDRPINLSLQLSCGSWEQPGQNVIAPASP